MIQGLGGAFLYAEDLAAMTAWYRDTLGIPLQQGGPGFTWAELPSADRVPAGRVATTTFALFQADAPLDRDQPTARLNFRVDDLDATLATLRDAGQAIETSDDESYGRFAWVRDPEGNKVELWEPPRAAETIAYTVRCAFTDARVAEAWLQWLEDEHLADVLAAGAIGAEVVRLDGPDVVLEVRYRFANRDAFATYEEHHAPRLRAEGLARFPLELGLTYSRSVGVIATRA